MFNALVVDDDPHVCSLTARALTRYRFECATAADGDEALEKCSHSAYDAVVTDLRMPRRHGHSLAVELLQRQPRPKIVVLTGLAEPKLVDDLVHRGVDEVVQKPADYNTLARTVFSLVAPDEMKRQAASKAAAAKPEGSQKEKLAMIESKLIELTERFTDRLSGLFESVGDLSSPPPAVNNFITRQAEIEAAADAAHKPGQGFARDARKAIRVRCRVTAVALPLDDQFALMGTPFKVAVRDLSTSGLRLLNTRSTNAKFLALGWSAETQPLVQISVVAKVMRCRPLSPFYDIGCQFVQEA